MAKAEWREGRYNSTELDCGFVRLTVIWAHSKPPGYVWASSTHHASPDGKRYETHEAAQDAAVRWLRGALKRALAACQDASKGGVDE